ncbi:hypothetical protein ACFQ7B_05015 [Streptomyces erythrochromogenes]|uniref:hypothetical protein n=1 Tax=Streptomyces erythrochromogenes TaxID=285574 RepID=UPI0036C6CD7F
MRILVTAAFVGAAIASAAVPAFADGDPVTGIVQGVTAGSDSDDISGDSVRHTTDIDIQKTPMDNPTPGLVQEVVNKLTG